MSVEHSNVFVSFEALASETTFRKRYDMIESAERGTTKSQRGLSRTDCDSVGGRSRAS